ncbi:MAG: hypothetical protein KJ749_04780 [Planctomycetes bacterium]|nr:hypothetical protein [Planctomycetota bacterium]
MNKLLSVFVLTAFLIPAAAEAQLPGKLKRAAEKVLEGVDDKGGEATTAQAGTNQRPPAYAGENREYAPGLSFSTVLNGVVVLAKDGKFQLNQIQATFIPDDCTEGFVVLRTAEGKELFQYDWRPDRLKKPYTLLNFHNTTDLQTGEKSGGGWKVLEPGAYVLDFYLPTEHFYTFPFVVEKTGGNDPFGDGQCYVMKGMWERWGYLYYSDANPDRNLEWKVWLRNDACNEKDVNIQVEIVRDSDGELVCTSREHTTNSVQPQWTRLAFDMVFPKGKDVPHGTYFKAKDLLATDGAYTLTMKSNGGPYGTWKFEIENGTPKSIGRTVRGVADPLTFIEGGRDAFWYERQ